MRVALVQTYPVYHDGVDTSEWISLYDREIGMAAYLARAGHEVELWAVGERGETLDLPAGEGPRIPLRIFPPRRRGGRTRDHWSRDLGVRAATFRAELYILNGLDGGAGVRLLKETILPGRHDFAFILGGGHYSRFVPRAHGVFYQTERQRDWLERPPPWRRAVPSDRLIFLPRTVDTGMFAPDPAAVREWDILVACRLVERLKNLSALAPLARRFRVAVAGSGPDEARIRGRIPQATWLGRVPHAELPRVMRASRLVMHTGRRELLPRVITEAMSCGVPVVAFAGLITHEVVPAECGLLITERDFVRPIADLLDDEEARRAMGAAARARAVARLSPVAFERPLEDMLRRLDR